MEIERKWLLNRLPMESREVLNRTVSKIVFLSTDPYVRVRTTTSTMTGKTSTKFCIKGKGSLSREEYEYPVDPEAFEGALRVSGKDPVTKDAAYYPPGDTGTELRIDIVDRGKPWEFIYAEVEFNTEEEAKAYEFPFLECSPIDVTHIGDFKMNRVWDRTRGTDDERERFITILNTIRKT